MQSESEYTITKESIRTQGLERRITLWRIGGEVFVIDGRNRLKALVELGIELNESMIEWFDGTEAEVEFFSNLPIGKGGASK